MSEHAPEQHPGGHTSQPYAAPPNPQPQHAAWTEQVGPPGEATAARGGERTKKDGAFSRLRKVAADKQAERRSAREEHDRKQDEDAQAAGTLVTSGVFGASTVEIYDGGYVRVAAGPPNATQPARITKNTPYEKLRSIKFTQPEQDQASSMTSALEGAVGPALAGLMKGGKTLMKASPTAVAIAGAAHLATNSARKAFLTIATDLEIHTLTNEMSNGFVKTSNKGHTEVGLVLEAAGIAVLGVVEVPAQQPPSAPQPVLEPHPVAVSQATTGPTLTERLHELADLHKEGILSDDEFGAAKAKLLGAL